MGKYYNEETVRSELELDKINAGSTEHYIKILENEVHRFMQVREELLEFRDAIADAVNVHGQCNQAILDEVRRIAYLFSLIDSDNEENIKNNKMFTTTEIFNPDYWHVGDAIEFTRKGKVGDTFKDFTRQALITKINYNIIDIEYIDGIRVGVTITLDDVKSGEVKIRKLI